MKSEKTLTKSVCLVWKVNRWYYDYYYNLYQAGISSKFYEEKKVNHVTELTQRLVISKIKTLELKTVEELKPKRSLVLDQNYTKEWIQTSLEGISSVARVWTLKILDQLINLKSISHLLRMKQNQAQLKSPNQVGTYRTITSELCGTLELRLEYKKRFKEKGNTIK